MKTDKTQLFDKWDNPIDDKGQIELNKLELEHDMGVVKSKLDSVGSGFCLAKWTQVSLHLQNGNTDSCHHPTPHLVPLHEIRNNPSALHNTNFKKLRRKEMLTGKRPDECDYCWNIEDSGNPTSDRILKSADMWSYPFYDKIKESEWNTDYNPHYVEVSFSNACNFKCSYCAPQFSSTWVKEIEEHGGYKTAGNFNSFRGLKATGKMPIPHTAHNPYVEAFWKWWPELYDSLQIFRITGGEPLMSPDTWKILDFIIDNPNPNKRLGLSINSNLGVSDRLIDKFISKIKQIEDQDKVRELMIFTSVDTWGPQAEYIRHGLEFNRFWDNVNKIMTQCPRVGMTFMVTYNALSVPNFEKLIKGIYDLKVKYKSQDRYWEPAVLIDVSYLRYPEHQTVKILPNIPWAEKVLDQAGLMEYYSVKPKFWKGTTVDPRFCEYPGYFIHEIEKVSRIKDWMLTPSDSKKIEINRRDFYRFFKEHDKRRNTDFCKVFPELEDFYNKCKNTKIKY